MQTLEIIKIIPDAGGGSLLCNLQREGELEIVRLPLDSLTYSHLETIIQSYPNCRYRISCEETTISIIHAHWIRRISFSPSFSFFQQVRALLGDGAPQDPVSGPAAGSGRDSGHRAAPDTGHRTELDHPVEAVARADFGNRMELGNRLESSNRLESGHRPESDHRSDADGRLHADSRPHADKRSNTGSRPVENGRRPHRYIPGLDGLRGVAVLVVLGYHLGVQSTPGGFLGVTMFLVLSGYLITDLLLAEWLRDRRIALKAFWARRARRLLPALTAMLAAVAAWVCLLDIGQFRQMQGDMISTLLFTSNWWYIFQNVSYFEQFGAWTPLRHTWSLGIEEQFYLIWPLLVLLGLKWFRHRWMLALLALAGAAASAWAMSALYEPSYDPSRVYYGTDTRAFSLLIGAALAFIWPSRHAARSVSRAGRIALDAAGVLCILGIVWMVWHVHEYQEFVYPLGMIAFSAMTAVAVAATVQPESVFARILGFAPLRWVGRRSYGIYIWHYPIIVLSAPSWPTSGNPLVVPLLQTALCFLVAALSWTWIEQPLLKGGWMRPPSTPRSGRRSRRRRRFPYGKAGIVAVIATVLSVSVYFKPPLEYVQVQGMYSGTLKQPEEDGAADAAADAAATGSTVAYADTEIGSADAAAEDGPTGGGPESGPAVVGTEGGPAGSGPEGGPTVVGTESGPVVSDAAVEAADVGAGSDAAGGGGNDGSTDADADGAATGAAVPGSAAAEEAGPREQDVIIIGDSVILSAERYLGDKLPDVAVDGKVGRQMHELPELVQQLQEQDILRDIVVIELGTNGSFTEKLLSSVIDALGEDRQIFVINTRVPRPWQDVVNERLSKAAETYPNVTLIDWFAASKGHSSYFAEDGVHLSDTGAKYYADIVHDAIFDQGERSQHVQ